MAKLTNILNVACLLGALVVPATALADNNVTLQRFGVCSGGVDDAECTVLFVDEAGFRAFSTDLGTIFAPIGATTAETLGQAGFAFSVDHTIHTIDTTAVAEGQTEAYWELADADGAVDSSLSTTQLHFRKGLPLSLELGALWTLMWDSDLSAVGAELRWSLHEDYLSPVPDVTVRGFANTVVGSRQLQMFNTGGDVTVSMRLGVGDVVNISPFLGYSMTAVIASSRLIDATPNDLTPATIDTISPEFAFDTDTVLVHRGFGGVRFQATLVDFLLQATIGETVQSYTASIGLDF